MAKSKQRPPITSAKFCSNCGQAVEGATAHASVSLSTAFCCNCQAALDSGGKCQNGQCKFGGFIPHCG